MVDVGCVEFLDAVVEFGHDDLLQKLRAVFVFEGLEAHLLPGCSGVGKHIPSFGEGGDFEAVPLEVLVGTYAIVVERKDIGVPHIPDAAEGFCIGLFVGIGGVVVQFEDHVLSAGVPNPVHMGLQGMPGEEIEYLVRLAFQENLRSLLQPGRLCAAAFGHRGLQVVPAG